MLKKLFFAAGCVALAFSASAQETVTVEESDVVSNNDVPYASNFTSKGTSNWFISAGAGPQMYFGDHDRQMKFSHRLSPALDVAFGKWFTPVVGLRFMYSGLYIKGATQSDMYLDLKDGKPQPIDGKPWHGYWLNKQKFNFMNLHMDMMFNLCNLIGGYNPNRIYSANLYVGVGYGEVLQRLHQYSVTGNVGLMNSFRISKAFDINLDLRATCFDDGFDGERGKRRFEGMFSATAGLTYKFAPRGWQRQSIVKTVSVVDNDALNGLRAQISELEAENARMANHKCEVKTVIETVAPDYIIYFKIDRYELSKAAKVQLELLANAIKESGTKVTYSVIGYADKGTGNDQFNEYLSQKRAQTVRDYLVNDLGIDPTQLNVSWKGGVGNMFFSDPALSRSVIISVEQQK